LYSTEFWLTRVEVKDLILKFQIPNSGSETHVLLFFIRHPESYKNISNQFSSDADDEPLTSKGKEDCLSIARGIKKIVLEEHLVCKTIYCADSNRSIETAKVLAEELKGTVKTEEALRSTKPGVLAGQSEEAAKKSHPLFIEQLNLYRAGLFNSYDFNVAENKEPKKDFEKRVLRCLDGILKDETESVKIVIAHRASITCMLLSFARKFYNYPYDFAGYVKLDLAKISLLKYEQAVWKIKNVNCDISEIVQRFNS
jgi:broad specificity phosphatase PhoE